MWSVVTIALKAIMTNKFRSFLTMLGVIIGVGSVVLLTSIGTGLQAYISDQFASLGSNTLYVVPGNPFGEGGGFGGEAAFIESTKPTLKARQVKEILRNNRELLTGGTATGFTTAEAKYKTTTKRATIYAVNSSYESVQNAPTEKGRWFTKNEEEKSERVAILGPEIAKELFGSVDPVNKKIKLDSQTYEVLGVLEARGSTFGGPSFDNYVFIPFETMADKFNRDLIDSLVFEVNDSKDIPAAKKAIEEVLLKELKEDEFTVFDQTQLLSTITSVLGVLTAGLVWFVLFDIGVVLSARFS